MAWFMGIVLAAFGLAIVVAGLMFCLAHHAAQKTLDYVLNSATAERGKTLIDETFYGLIGQIRNPFVRRFIIRYVGNSPSATAIATAQDQISTRILLGYLFVVAGGVCVILGFNVGRLLRLIGL